MQQCQNQLPRPSSFKKHFKRILRRLILTHSNACLEGCGGLFTAFHAKSRDCRTTTTFAAMIYLIVTLFGDLFPSA